MIVLFWYQFFARNFEYAEALVPRDENTIMKKTWSDFEIAAEFVGYAGCLNGTTDLDLDGVEDTEITIEEDGFYFRGTRPAGCRRREGRRRRRRVLLGRVMEACECSRSVGPALQQAYALPRDLVVSPRQKQWRHRQLELYCQRVQLG